MKKKWQSKEPFKCDICSQKPKGHFIDGKTKFGPWGIMCPNCHSLFGCGLGLGRGQKYDMETLEKVAG